MCSGVADVRAGSCAMSKVLAHGRDCEAAHVGWLETVPHETDSCASCLEYIEKNWTDMRPKSLIQAQGL
jgi:hypothetical protein